MKYLLVLICCFSSWAALASSEDVFFTDLMVTVSGELAGNEETDLTLRLELPFDESRTTDVSGSNLWRAKVWLSSMKGGGGPKLAFEKQILSDEVSSTPIDTAVNPLVFDNIAYTVDLTFIPCLPNNYVCVRFQSDQDQLSIFFRKGDGAVVPRLTVCAPVGCTDDPCAGIFCDIPTCLEGFEVDYEAEGCCPGCKPVIIVPPEPDPCFEIQCGIPMCPEGFEVDYEAEGCCPGCRPVIIVPPEPDPCFEIQCGIPMCIEGFELSYDVEGCCPGCVPTVKPVIVDCGERKNGDSWIDKSGGDCMMMSCVDGQIMMAMPMCMMPECENPVELPDSCCPMCPEPIPESCSMEPDSGLCLAYFPRYFFNATSGSCEKFVYGGCGGNSNNFESLEECEAECVLSKPGEMEEGPMEGEPMGQEGGMEGGVMEGEPMDGEPMTPEGGMEAPENGTNVQEGEPMIGGDGGMDETTGEGMEGGEDGLMEPKLDIPPPDCDGYSEGDSWEPVPCMWCSCYSGRKSCAMPFCRIPCDNPIPGEGHCCPTCPDEPETEPQPEVEPEPAPVGNVCSMPPETGMCRAYVERYAYNPELETCETFVYGGCRGNGNNFMTKDDCLLACAPAVQPPVLPPVNIEKCDEIVCFLIYAPVCATSGETFSNECVFDVAKCKNPTLEIASYGECEEGPSDVENVEESECQRQARVEGERLVVGNFIPVCAENGDFAPQQCHGSTGYCWCVDENGLEIDGTSRGPTEERVNCSAPVAACDGYKEGDEWMPEPCMMCVCSEGSKVCASPRCAPPLCDNPVKEGVCCPVCPEDTTGLPPDCDGYAEGDSWESQPCEMCSCLMGSKICASPDCYTPCPDAIPGEGVCCPTCPDGPREACDNYATGDSWSTDGGCTNCICELFGKICVAVECPEPGCISPKTVEGECCKQCLDPLRVRVNNMNVRAKPRLWRGETPVVAKLQIAVRTSSRSENVTGQGLWKVSMWLDSSKNGDGDRLWSVDQILSDEQSSQPLYSSEDLIFESVSVRIGGPGYKCPETDHYYCFAFMPGDESSVELNFSALGKKSLMRCIKAPCLSSSDN